MKPKANRINNVVTHTPVYCFDNANGLLRLYKILHIQLM